jgi:hypothetical protein
MPGLLRLKIKNGFGSHTEEQVQNAQIRQETVFVLKYLPVGFRLEVIVWKWVLGVYHITIIGTLLPLTVIGRGVFYLGLNVYQLADILTDSLVEIDEKVVALLEEGADIISIVFEERTLAICRL